MNLIDLDEQEDIWPPAPAGYYERFVMPDDEEVPDRPHTFACSTCQRDVTVEPCPDHAPLMAPPGLRLTECTAEPRHWAMVLDRDDYGPGPCPWCLLGEYYEKERQARWCRHWSWRRWRIMSRLDLHVLRPLKLTNGSSWQSGEGHSGCYTWHWRWHITPAKWRRGAR